MILAGEVFPLSDNLRHPFGGYNLPMKKQAFKLSSMQSKKVCRTRFQHFKQEMVNFLLGIFPYCVVDASVIATVSSHDNSGKPALNSAAWQFTIARPCEYLNLKPIVTAAQGTITIMVTV
jgi:hypothetical protein